MEPFELDAGNTAWMLAAASLVLLMTPALAFFYGGMTRSKSVLNMMVISFGALAVVGPIWMLWGYSETFGSNVAGIIGDPFEFFALHNLTDDGSLMAATGVPATVAVGYQATFAIITVALISGAVADCARFGTWLVFSGLWITLVYAPIAHMVWGGGALSGGGFIADWLSTPIDFAGGTVVHINAGMAGFMLLIIIGKRKGFAKEPMEPHNPFVMLGAALLWFGWFGFTAGSEFAADGTAGQAWINTLTATCVASLGWLGVQRIRDRPATGLGAASGVVAGLVAITPAAGAVDIIGAMAIGLAAGVLCALAVGLKYRFGYDDHSLDVVGVHLVGGVVGIVLIGLFANVTRDADGVVTSYTWAPDGALNGLFYGGGFTQLATQIAVAVIVILISGVMTVIIGLALKYTMGWRIPQEHEVEGVRPQHAW